MKDSRRVEAKRKIGGRGRSMRRFILGWGGRGKSVFFEGSQAMPSRFSCKEGQCENEDVRALSCKSLTTEIARFVCSCYINAVIIISKLKQFSGLCARGWGINFDKFK
jgi:hypothetical protein